MPDLPLVVRDLHKHYSNGVKANRGISFIGYPGEILGILGPNGAGKSTLVRQITTELLPTSGSITVFGRDVVSESLGVKRTLGIMPQEAALFGYLTVYQHIRIFGKLRGLSAKESVRRTEKLIDTLDLTHYRDIPVEKLSGGLMRRVLVAIASLDCPPVMVLDEPTTGLDPQSRRNLWTQVRKTRDAGSFVLLTTHSMEEAETLCDRVGIINDGHLLKLDTIPNLRAELEYQFKVTYLAGDTQGNPQNIYGTNEQELVEKVRKIGVHNFSVSRTNLEDVYLSLTGELSGFDNR